MSGDARARQLSCVPRKAFTLQSRTSLAPGYVYLKLCHHLHARKDICILHFAVTQNVLFRTLRDEHAYAGRMRLRNRLDEP